MSILCMFICRDDVIYVETPYNLSKLCNFIASRKIKNAIKLCERLFPLNINKNSCGKVLWTFVGKTSLMLNSKHDYFIISWKMITAQHAKEGSFFIKLAKICQNKSKKKTELVFFDIFLKVFCMWGIVSGQNFRLEFIFSICKVDSSLAPGCWWKWVLAHENCPA